MESAAGTARGNAAAYGLQSALSVISSP